MADNKIIQTLKMGNTSFSVKPCWSQLGLTQEYMLALLSRDEYTPVATSQPTSTTTLYTDPVSGNPAGFHPGQCVIYPDKDADGGWGLSIAKTVVEDAKGIPVSVAWYHATDIEKRLKFLEDKFTEVLRGCFGNAQWINDLPWLSEVSWNNGN